jgi:hypothetical protein
MMVATDLGAIRLAVHVPAMTDLTANERHWISLLRDVGGGIAPPPTLAAVQAVRRVMHAT